MFTLYSSKISFGKPVHISGLEMIPKLRWVFFSFSLFPFLCPSTGRLPAKQHNNSTGPEEQTCQFLEQLYQCGNFLLLVFLKTKASWFLTTLFWEAFSLVISSVHLSQCSFTLQICSSPGGCQLGPHPALHQTPEEGVGWEVSCKINYSSICKESSVSKLTLKKGTSLPISIFSA